MISFNFEGSRCSSAGSRAVAFGIVIKRIIGALNVTPVAFFTQDMGNEPFPFVEARGILQERHVVKFDSGHDEELSVCAEKANVCIETTEKVNVCTERANAVPSSGK